MVPADRHTFDLKQIGSTYFLVLLSVTITVEQETWSENTFVRKILNY